MMYRVNIKGRGQRIVDKQQMVALVEGMARENLEFVSTEQVTPCNCKMEVVKDGEAWCRNCLSIIKTEVGD